MARCKHALRVYPPPNIHTHTHTHTHTQTHQPKPLTYTAPVPTHANTPTTPLTVPHSCQHTNRSYLLHSTTAVMLELEATASLKCFNPAASVTLLSPARACCQSTRSSRGAPPHPTPTQQPAGASRHQRTFVVHFPDAHTTPLAYISTHGPTHANTPTNKHLLLRCTVVMVELEATAALKSFKPASVMLSPVCVIDQHER